METQTENGDVLLASIRDAARRDDGHGVTERWTGGETSMETRLERVGSREKSSESGSPRGI